MDGDTRYSIGELARLTGLTVKAIRFYSDRGIVPATDRDPAGHRRYDDDARARLELVRTLRDLGLDLATVRRVLASEVSLPEMAAAHADALEIQIRTLRLRHAVLTAVATRGSSPEETRLMHQLARLTEEQRRLLIDDFLDSVFGGLESHPAIAGIMRTMTPELPGNATTAQLRAWVELAELTQDPDFRAMMRRLIEQYTTGRAPGLGGPDPVAAVRAQVAPVLAAGIDPESAEADSVVEAIISRYGETAGQADDLKQQLLARLETANQPQRERYVALLGVVNGWGAAESLGPALDWSVRALRARLPV